MGIGLPVVEMGDSRQIRQTNNVNKKVISPTGMYFETVRGSYAKQWIDKGPGNL
jgi:hypothetical protein